MKRYIVLMMVTLSVVVIGFVGGAVSAVDSSAATRPAVTPLEKVSALVQPSIVYIETTWMSRVFDTSPSQPQYAGFLRNKPFSSTFRCSGFFVTPVGHIITAGHCAQFDQGVRNA